MEYKEHAIHFLLQGKIRLSLYDQKFLSNLQIIIHKSERITSNQANLVNTLLGKYSFQLKKHGYVSGELIALPWRVSVVESTDEYTGARISLVDNDIILRVPYSKKFIAEFKEVKINPFLWMKEEGYYRAPFSTLAIQSLLLAVPKHFKTSKICDELSPLFNELDECTNSVRLWDPTLVKSNGNLYVAAANTTLGNIIADMDLKEDPHTLFNLSQLGIDVDPSLKTSPFMKFAGSYITEVDLDNMQELPNWVKDLGCTEVVLSVGIGRTNREVITKLFEGSDIKITTKYTPALLDAVKTKRESTNTMIVQPMSQPRNPRLELPFSKIIVLSNSRPVDIS